MKLLSRTPFKSTGFDSLINKGTRVLGPVEIAGCMKVEGHIVGDVTEAAKGSLHVEGEVSAKKVNVTDVTITGVAHVDDLWVEGTLAVKAGATLKAQTIHYRTLVVEPGCVLQGELKHLDHCSEGETV